MSVFLSSKCPPVDILPIPRKDIVFALNDPDFLRMSPDTSYEASLYHPPKTETLGQRVDLNDLLTKSPKETFVLRISDNTASEAGIQEGDLLIVDRSIPPENQQAVVFFSGESLAIKRFSSQDKAKGSKIWGVVTHRVRSCLVSSDAEGSNKTTGSR